MEGWHPRASRVPATRDGGTYADGYPWRQVIHTTEVAAYNASTTSYYGHASYPHATIHAGRIYQHIPITRAARALKNLMGGVETNRARAVQVEVAWKAADIHRLPADQRAALADWLTWVHDQTGCPLTGPVFVGAEQRPAGVRAAQRLSAQEWKSFAGVCGHQHVAENDHWDPGALNLNAVLAFADQGDDDLTPEQATQLRELHAVLVGNRREREKDDRSHDLATPILATNGHMGPIRDLLARLAAKIVG